MKFFTNFESRLVFLMNSKIKKFETIYNFFLLYFKNEKNL